MIPPLDVILFFLFGAVAVGSSLAVVTSHNPMHSVLLLIVSFAALAGLYIGLDSPFTAVTQIIVYAGAIMVLFLFVVAAVAVVSAAAVAAATAAAAVAAIATDRCFAAMHTKGLRALFSCLNRPARPFLFHPAPGASPLPARG